MALVVLAASVAAAASEDTVAEARKAFVEGQKAYKAKNYARAVAAFETVYRLKPHPVVRFNLARSIEKLGDTRRALREYRTFLVELPDSSDRTVVEKAIASLEKKLRKESVQQLMVHADPDDATVSVDGKALGKVPAFVELGPGEHRVVVERSGLATVSQTFTMPADRSLGLRYVLQPLPREETPPVVALPPPPPPPPPQLAAAEGPSGRVEVAPAPPPGLRSRFWIPLIAVGVGGAAAGVGFVQTFSLSGALDAELSSQRSVTPLALDLARQGEIYQIVAWAGVGVAAAGAVATVLFLVLPGPTVRPSVAIGPGGASFGVAGELP